jgi:hypothetical protein
MRVFVFIAALWCATAQAAPWEFDAPIAVTGDATPRAFFHLESSGRKNIAVSASWVAVVWEDNRDGVPRCYAALKAPGAAAFAAAMPFSGKDEAAEPAIVGLGGGRFAVAWEEAGRVWVRTVTAKSLGTPLALAANPSAQVSMGAVPHGALLAVWSEKGERFWQIRLARLAAHTGGGLRVVRSVTVDPAAAGDQSYPSIASASAGKAVVAWEDRRAGHTRLLYAVSRDGGVRFAPPQQLNESVWRGQSLVFGRGTGVMRVALASRGRDGVAAVWADKRDFQSGYDVYGGFAPGASLHFGPNEKVQDQFGDNIAQWHPAIAANAQARVAVAWDDDRDGSPDVWLSWRDREGWSDDLAPPGASGPGVQSDPSIAMDEAGNLHLAWLEKADLNSSSRIRYMFGRVK